MTPTTPNNRHLIQSPERQRRVQFLVLPFFIFLSLSLLSLQPGCGMTQGRWLWALGFDKQFKRPPEFELTVEGPVLILVDDPEYRLDAPRTRTDLARKIVLALETGF